MKRELNFRNLKRDDIEVRMQGQVYNPETKQFGVNLLLYKDARCDMSILDETVGEFGWQREHIEVSGKVCCKVSIQREDGTWVSKMDVGTESSMEAVKGNFSDAFKRACFSWGIGRELYTAPSIVVYEGAANLKDKDGKKVTYDKFAVVYVETVDKTIVGLVVVNKSLGDKIILEYGTGKDRDKVLKSLVEEKGIDWGKVANWIEKKGLKSVNDLPEEEYTDYIRRLL